VAGNRDLVPRRMICWIVRYGFEGLEAGWGERTACLWSSARPVTCALVDIGDDRGAQLTGLVPLDHSPDARASAPFRRFEFLRFRDSEMSHKREQLSEIS